MGGDTNPVLEGQNSGQYFCPTSLGPRGLDLCTPALNHVPLSECIGYTSHQVGEDISVKSASLILE